MVSKDSKRRSSYFQYPVFASLGKALERNAGQGAGGPRLSFLIQFAAIGRSESFGANHQMNVYYRPPTTTFAIRILLEQ